jgi:hypothetical protein
MVEWIDMVEVVKEPILVRAVSVVAEAVGELKYM